MLISEGPEGAGDAEAGVVPTPDPDRGGPASASGATPRAGSQRATGSHPWSASDPHPAAPNDAAAPADPADPVDPADPADAELSEAAGHANDSVDGDDAPDRLESVPPAAAEVFGPALPLARRYAELLATDGVQHGLLGPREAPRLWSRHLLNCAVVAPLVPPDAVVCDLGSGAGLPGIPIALARPDLRVLLAEPLLRRATFLAAAVEALGLSPRVTVDRARSDELIRRGEAFDAVVVRAVAPLDRLLAWTIPLLHPGGVLLAMKGSSAHEELAAARAALDTAGVDGCDILEVGAGTVDPATTVVRVVAGRRAAARHGRRRRG